MNLDVTSKYLDSHTSYFHQEADSYQNNGKAVDADGKEYETIAPLFIGFNSNVINQRFDIKPAMNFSMYAGGSYSYKLTDRPDSRTDITGGSDYGNRFLTLSVMGYMNFVDNMIVKENITVDDDVRAELAKLIPLA